MKSRRTEKRALVLQEREVSNSLQYQGLPSFLLIGSENEVYLCYTLKHLRGGPIDLALHENRRVELNAAGDVPANDQIFRQAVLSFAVIFFGTRHRQTSIINNGYALLGGTLRQLNQALSDSKCYVHDAIILSVVTLALLESFVPTGPNHFLQHMLGLERLIELRSPDAYRDPRSIQLLRGTRHMILFVSLCTRKPSMLAKPEWKKILRANSSEQAAQEQDLFDVIADCTVLLSDRDNMLAISNHSEKSQRERDRIARKALVLLAFLHSWKERWDADKANSHFTQGVLSGSYSTHNSVLVKPPFSLGTSELPSETAATVFMLYNTALIWVLRVLTSLTSTAPESQNLKHSSLHDAENAFHSLQKQINDEHIAAERLAALQICSCLPYLFRKSSMGSRNGHLAATTAWTALGADRTAEGRWIRNASNTPDREFIAKGLWVEDVQETPRLDEADPTSSRTF